MTYRILFLASALSLSACAGQPAQSGVKASKATSALYAMLSITLGKMNSMVRQR